MQPAPRSAYRTLNPDPTPKELARIFTPTVSEISLSQQWAKQPTPRLGCLLFLKLFQHLGYFPPIHQVRSTMVKWLAEQSGLHYSKIQALKRYSESGTAKRHRKLILNHLGVTPYSTRMDSGLSELAHEAATTKHTNEDIINVLLEELIRQKSELPRYDKLHSLAAKARHAVNEQCYTDIVAKLTPKAKRLIDELLTFDAHQSYTQWNNLKKEPKKPTNKAVREYLHHVHWLRNLNESLPKIALPPLKYQYFITEARALDAADMRRLKPQKRYALTVILIKAQHSKALDDVAALYERLVSRMETSAQQSLKEHILKQQKVVDQLVAKFRQVLLDYQANETPKQQIAAMTASLDGDAASYIHLCDEHLAFADNNFIPFMQKPYAKIRSLLINCLNIVTPRSTSNDILTEKFIDYLIGLKDRKVEFISLSELHSQVDVTLKPEDFPEKWRKQISPKSAQNDAEPKLHRRYLELYILTVVKHELSSMDLFVPFSDEYLDYREELVDDATLDEEIPIYAEQVELPLTEAKLFSQHLKQCFTETVRRVDSNFPDNAFTSIKDSRLVLHLPTKRKPVEGLDLVDAELKKRIPTASIVDVLTDVTKWLDLHQFLSPLSGSASRLDNKVLRFVVTLFCYGCNLGPSQVERSIRGLSRHQIAWLNRKQVSMEKLEALDRKIINTYRKFTLPTFWGTGKSAAADGTKWDLYEQNLMSEYHIRHGGYGGIGYYHVSDTYIALFSHFIPCGVFEGVYILDGLMKNESDIQPDTVHGDTQAQNYVVFALSYLLGIKLMPRIRNIHDLILYRPDKRHRYTNIDELFGDQSINYTLIETHLRDMLRVVISIKKGKISPSTILKRLRSRSRKNKLYFAFKELGKVIRTQFLMEYINDVEVRRMITAATNKNEEFNYFTKWLFFGGDGIIAENLRPQQQMIIKYNQIVANMATLYNVEKMEGVFAELIEEGWDITPEIAAGFSPYRMSTTNRFGDYNVDVERELTPINFGREIIKKP